MSTQWLAVQSFQQSQDLLAAINTLSIYLKLRFAGLSDERRAQSVAKAKATLAAFLKTLEKVVHQVEQTKAGPLTGVDPRLRQLAQSFVAAKQDKCRFHSDLFSKSPARVAELLEATEPDDQKALVESLAELRTLLEEHIYSDVTQILEEI